jgi:hypothetical protein
MSSRRWTPARQSGRVAGGAAALRAGRTFEEELEATHASAEYSALCAMARAFPPVGGPPGALFYRGKGKVDFVGHVLGVPVALRREVEQRRGVVSPRPARLSRARLPARLARARRRVLPARARSLDRHALPGGRRRAPPRRRERAAPDARARPRGPSPVVPAIVCTEAARLIATVKRAPVWPWLQIAAPTYPAIARALGLEPRRPPDVQPSPHPAHPPPFPVHP